MEIELIITIITTVSSLILGMFVALKNPRSATNVYFSLLLFSISLYPVFNYLTLRADSAQESFTWAKFILFTAIPAGPLFYFFVRTFPESKFIFNSKIQLLLTSWVVVNLVLAYFGLIFSSVSITNGEIEIVTGPAVISFGLLQVGGIVLGIYSLINKYRSSTGFLKKQLDLIVTGVSVSFLLTLLATLVFPLFLGWTFLVSWSPLFLLLGAAAIAMSIIRYQLLDIRPVLARTVSYILVLVIFAFFHSIIIFLLSNLFLSQWVGKHTASITIVLAITTAFTFQPLIKVITKVTGRFFYKDYYDLETVIHKLTLIMASTLFLEDLGRSLLNELVGTLKAENATLFLTEDDHVYQVLNEGKELNQEIDEEEIRELQLQGKILVYEEVSDQKIRMLLEKYQFGLTAVLRKEGKAVGLLALGNKKSGDSFSKKDIRLLTIFVQEAAVAIQNAKSYEEIRRFNITLEEEVENATKRLVTANEKLQELDQLKDEFVSIASHELRTPMVSIKNYLWMTLAGKGGKITRKQKFYLDRAYDSSNRMSKLINDLLNISRIESGRIILNVEKVSITDLAHSIIDEIKPKADQAEVKLVINRKDAEGEVLQIPEVVADKDKIAEVFVNILGNAIKFTPPKGKIILSFEEKKAEKIVVVHISDTGVGLSKEQIPKLFQKFGMIRETYRSKSEAAQGTGLGLYVSKSIIELHGGKIWAESAGSDTGTTFSFTLPVYTKETLEKLQKKFSSETDVGIIRSEKVSESNE